MTEAANNGLPCSRSQDRKLAALAFLALPVSAPLPVQWHPKAGWPAAQQRLVAPACTMKCLPAGCLLLSSCLCTGRVAAQHPVRRFEPSRKPTLSMSTITTFSTLLCLRTSLAVAPSPPTRVLRSCLLDTWQEGQRGGCPNGVRALSSCCILSAIGVCNSWVSSTGSSKGGSPGHQGMLQSTCQAACSS